MQGGKVSWTAHRYLCYTCLHHLKYDSFFLKSDSSNHVNQEKTKLLCISFKVMPTCLMCILTHGTYHLFLFKSRSLHNPGRECSSIKGVCTGVSMHLPFILSCLLCKKALQVWQQAIIGNTVNERINLTSIVEKKHLQTSDSLNRGNIFFFRLLN